MFGRKKKEGGRAFRREMAKKLDGRHIKYVTERGGDYAENVVGREGALIVKGAQLLVYSSADVVFRGNIDDTDFSELLSLEGVIITGGDLEHGGAERTVIAYYTYYI